MTSTVPGGRAPVSVAIFLLLPLLLTALAYAPVSEGELQFDDVSTVQHSRHIRSLGNLLPTGVLTGALRGERSLTNLSLAVNYRLGGLAPLPYHLTNVAFHLAAVVLVFLFTTAVLTAAGASRSAEVALAVAGIFALHPLQTEAVAYITQRSEVLASTIYLGVLLLLFSAERRGLTRRAVPPYAAAFALFVLGFGAKVIVVSLPFVYLAAGALLPASEGQARLGVGIRRRLLLMAPFFMYLPIPVIGSLRAMKGADAGFAVPGLSPPIYFLTEWRVLVAYLRLLLWPVGQNVDWDVPASRGLSSPTTLAPGIFLVALLATGAVVFRRARKLATPWGAAGRVACFGVVWFFVILAPTSSLVPLADVMVEHRLYLACWGPFVVVVVLAERLLDRFGARASAWAGAITLCVWLLLGTATFVRSSAWVGLELWMDAAEKSPHKARPRLAIANRIRARGETDRSVTEYRAALALAAHEPTWMRNEIRSKLAAALLALRQPDSALAELLAGLSEEPNEPQLLGLIAFAHLARRDLADAERFAARGAEVATHDKALSLRTLAVVRLGSGNPAGAEIALKEAARRDPYDPQIPLLLARAYRELGRAPEACVVLREALARLADNEARDALRPVLLESCSR